LVQTLGVPILAEITPSKPDAGNAAEGKRIFSIHWISSLKFNNNNSGMEIKLNNQIKTFPEQCTVQQLLDEVVPEKQKGIAVAVNSSVIPKTNWSLHFLKNKDEVLIIKATQGG